MAPDKASVGAVQALRSADRVTLIGPPGSGKSTLGPRLGLPVVHPDRLFWHPGWVPTPHETWIGLQEDGSAATAG